MNQPDSTTQRSYESPPVPGQPVSAVPTPGAVSDSKPQVVENETPKDTNTTRVELKKPVSSV